MRQKMNYINALPDFLAMQRVSFCWFITQGLNEELALFSKIHDFSQNTEYIMFSEEYNLIKPPYSLLIARKYSGNYRAQLVIPIEVRNKTINNIRYHNQFPIITLPLMTTYATFIINGCERVIVSQIIRSPGIYFEKPKNQKTQKQFKRKLSTDINKLRTFLPSGEAFISESDLFFSVPLFTSDKIKKRKKIIPNWNQNTIYYYSLKYLKDSNQTSTYYLFQCFKFYQLISKNMKLKDKDKLIQLFIKWLKLKNQNFKFDIDENNVNSILNYFQFIATLLIKYQVCQSSNLLPSINLSIQTILDDFNFSKSQLSKLLQIYTKTIFNSQTSFQLRLNYNLVLGTKNTTKWLSAMENFQFLKIKFNNTLTKVNELNLLIDSANLSPSILNLIDINI
jgi:DNA-directed RNA polymerase beta subunit